MALFPHIVEELKKRGLTDVLIYAGIGIIPTMTLPAIKVGIAGVFGPGTPMADAVRFVRDNVHTCATWVKVERMPANTLAATTAPPLATTPVGGIVQD